MSGILSPNHMDPVLQFFNERPDATWKWDFEDTSADSAVNAVALANLSLLAYSGQNDVGRFLKSWNFDDFRFLSAGATEGFVARITDPETKLASVFVSYRGTEPAMIIDWLSDVQFHQAPLQGMPGKVHGGFGRAAAMVQTQTIQALNDLPGSRHYFTGHSMGGAIAVVAAAVFRQIVTAVYTYGQPRVGDETFSNAYDQALGKVTFRYVDNFDIVPHLPPKQLPAPFPPVRFPTLSGGLLGLGQQLEGNVETLVTGELFQHVGQLKILLGDGTISTSFADWRARDPFEVPANPLEALALVRGRLNLALNGGRELLDHDPVTGYLPKLERQVRVTS
jgi:triacylglycerol lipase